MAYSDKEWQICRAFYERGLSLNEIIAREEVTIKSKSQISKRATAECWVKGGEKKQLLDREIAAKQEVVSIKREKETLKETDLLVHNALVDERTAKMIFFADAAVKNVQEAMAAACEGQRGYLERAQTILKGREAALGKEATNQTNVQVNQTHIGARKVYDLTDDELLSHIRSCG